MSTLGPLIAVAILIAIGLLAPIFGVDSRPGAADPPQVWFRHRS